MKRNKKLTEYDKYDWAMIWLIVFLLSMPAARILVGIVTGK